MNESPKQDTRHILEIETDAQGTIVSRPNRFLTMVDIEGQEERAHVHDPGRLKELLYPGNSVLLKGVDKPGRSTKWDVIAAKWRTRWILIHSGYHREISERILRNRELNPFGKITQLKPEVVVGHSRLDYMAVVNGLKTGIEVKGCTLAIDGKALFPDAPTTRGRKHLETLIEMKQNGMGAALLVLIFRTDAQSFGPNKETDPLFSETFWKAVDTGVDVKPVVLEYEGNNIFYKGTIPLEDPI